jgi:uncharacterized protein (DUF1501 family)
VGRSWDSRADNFGVHGTTLVVCLGEFGRTPRINKLDGRDHFSRGFSVVLAGKGIRCGVVVGETDPSGEKPPVDSVGVGDLLATVYTALGLDPVRGTCRRRGGRSRSSRALRSRGC